MVGGASMGAQQPGLLKGVTWLELVADFELATGIDCKYPQNSACWGKRAETLRSVLKLVLKVRSPTKDALEKAYGTSRRITSLAPFGALHLGGLRRRPVFAAEATPKVVAVNAWQWAEEGKVQRLQLHEVSYKNFQRGEGKLREVQERLEQLVPEEAPSSASVSSRPSASVSAAKKASFGLRTSSSSAT